MNAGEKMSHALGSGDPMAQRRLVFSRSRFCRQIRPNMPVL
jgi:hypothetical protein